MNRKQRWCFRIRRLGDLLLEFYQAPYRGAIAREQREQDDLLMLMVFSHALGIPNPTYYYMLELLPVLLDRYHDWHKRMGMEHSPLDNFRCC
jgi:hypothetical protein